MSILNQKNNASDVNIQWFNKYTWTLDNGLECSSSNNFMVTNSSLKKLYSVLAWIRKSSMSRLLLKCEASVWQRVSLETY